MPNRCHNNTVMAKAFVGHIDWTCHFGRRNPKRPSQNRPYQKEKANYAFESL